MNALWLKIPLEKNVLSELVTGQWVNLTGSLFTARDAALGRINELLFEGKTPPVDLRGQLVYFAGPTPPAPDQVVGAVGPTTSQRMETYLPSLIQAGVNAVMGKGPLSAGAVSELMRFGVIYLAAAGGAGAFYGSKVKGATVVAYEELGPEAIHCLRVENFPAVVALDQKGDDLFKKERGKYGKKGE